MLLRSRGRDQTWLAEKLGVHHVTVSNWVRGIHVPKGDSLRKIADLLECEPDEITGGTLLMTDAERRLLSAYRTLAPQDRALVDKITDSLARKRPSDAHESDLAPPLKKHD